MAAKDENPPKKISEPFRARLAKLGAKEKTRAVVLLYTPLHENGIGQRQSRAERQATIEAVRAASMAAATKIDDILEENDGRRLADPNALGSVPVETTRAGILALAESDGVKAVLEDQSISSAK